MNKKLFKYLNNTPKFDFRKFFDGAVIAKGILQNRSGIVTRRFSIDMHGSWQGNTGVLTEKFQYDDGVTEHRQWHINFIDGTNYKATAADIVGTARGVQLGNSANTKYTMKLKVAGKFYKVAFDDWMYQIDDTSVFNCIKIKKLGITFATASIFIKN